MKFYTIVTAATVVVVLLQSPSFLIQCQSQQQQQQVIEFTFSRGFLELARATMNLINTARAAFRLPTLCLNKKLMVSAQLHSDDMQAMTKMSHEGSNGSTPGMRVTEAGFVWRAVGENIAYGFTTAPSVFQAWMNSPDHRENILDSDYIFFGFGLTGLYWTNNFGLDYTAGTETCWDPFEDEIFPKRLFFNSIIHDIVTMTSSSTSSVPAESTQTITPVIVTITITRGKPTSTISTTTTTEIDTPTTTTETNTPIATAKPTSISSTTRPSVVVITVHLKPTLTATTKIKPPKTSSTTVSITTPSITSSSSSKSIVFVTVTVKK